MASREFKGIPYYIISGIGLLLCLFQLYTAYMGPFTPMVQRGLFVGLGFLLLFLLVPSGGKKKKSRLSFVDLLCALLSVVIAIYGIVNFTEADWERVVTPNTLDMAFGILLIVFALEGTRRTGNTPLSLVAIGSLVYFFLGPYLPGVFRFPRIEAYNLIVTNYMSLEGILGTIMGAVANMIFMYVLFGALLLEFGGGDFFIKLSNSLFGSLRGGPAKIAVVASGFFGMISGVGPLIVMATGVVTIPMMKSIGYPAHYAGAVEATAASGGQIMPPVMGIAAFIMADLLGISYLKVCLAALLPAILYYAAVFFMVHLEAIKLDIKTSQRVELPRISNVVKEGWKFVLPMAVLVVWIGYFEAGAALSAFYANIALIAFCLLDGLIKKRKLELRKLFAAFESSVKQATNIVATVATVGIIIGVINLSGAGLKLSTIMIQLSHGALPILLFLTMIASLILGMGMPTVACYTILAVLAAPAMVKLGVLPIAAHMFVFYFGMLSAVTPPVALSVIAAVTIANSGFWKTGWASVKLAFSGFIIPFIFVYQPVLLLQGGVGEIILATIASLIGIFVLSVAITNYFTRELSVIERLPLFPAAILLIYPGWVTDAVGLVIALSCLGSQLVPLLGRARVFRPT